MPTQIPSVSQAIIDGGGGSVFRINQPLLPGDIFELNGSVHGVAIGPDSDVPEVNLVYLDKQLTPFGANEVAVSVGRPWRDLLVARLDDTYPSGAAANFPNIEGRILAYATALVVPGFVPLEVGVASIVTTIDPRIDLIGEIQPGPLPAQRRAPFLYRSLVEVAADPSFFVFPFYGRRFMSVNAAQYVGAVAFTAQIRGHNFFLPSSAAAGTDPLVSTTSITGPTALGAPGQLNFVVDSQVHGIFDMISVAIAGPATSGAIDPPPVSVKVEARDE